MEEAFLPAPGDATVPREELKNAKAADLAARLAAGEIAHARLVECRRLSAAATVVFDLRLEVPNHRVHDIRRRERIAARFPDSDVGVPEVTALRRDFPLVPHLNLRPAEYPRSLCLYEERYEELKRSWTTSRFVQRIREWLELTASGELHGEDQPLEPLLLHHAGDIVLPADLDGRGAEPLYLEALSSEESRRCFLRARREAALGEVKHPFVTSIHRCEPRTHGVIRQSPRTLHELAELARHAGCDLVAELRKALPNWKDEYADSPLILVLIFPTSREGGDTVDEVWCFMTGQPVRAVGIGLGIWSEAEGVLGGLAIPDESRTGQDISILVLNPCFELARDQAAQLNGRSHASELSIVGIGVGALGSQVLMNLARAGFGRWTLIDPDRLMPHNLARHALGGAFVGFNKAQVLAAQINNLTFGEDVATALDVDLLQPRDQVEAVREALASAEVVLDMTASVAAERHLARDVESPARRVSMFLNPSGTDLVVLAEDAARDIKLDALEMQYCRALLRNVSLEGHIPEEEQGGYRYGRSCGDLTSDIPQDGVALHAAIASRRVKETLAESGALIGIWRIREECRVERVAVGVERVLELKRGEWTVVLDEGLVRILSDARAAKLPAETGGVLLGAWDLARRIIYLVDTLPSPPDSDERSDLYIRGCEGLSEAVLAAAARTGKTIEYVGEWHSHPAGAGTEPSSYDAKALEWLRALMSRDGLPAVMAIVGDSGDVEVLVDSPSGESAPAGG